MGSYFVIQPRPTDDEDPAFIEIEDWKAPAGFDDWSTGQPAEQRPKKAVTITAVPYGGYTGAPPDYQDQNVPLMSLRLKKVLDAAGVKNLKYLPITVRNKKTKKTYRYVAFNIVGVVAAADRKKSKLKSHDRDMRGDTSIHDLVIDEKKCEGLLMFRLYENWLTVLVHRKVKQAIERAGIDSVELVKPEDYVQL